MYSIGEVSKMFHLPVSTLRYYDKEGLLLQIQRSPAGVRKFDDQDIRSIRMIEYLKKAGMRLRDIKTFMGWCQAGDSTLVRRRDMFLEKKEAVDAQIRELERTRDLICFKCWYYTTAVREGTEARVRSLPPEAMPEDVRKAFENSHPDLECTCSPEK